jgi:hypothetical protein
MTTNSTNTVLEDFTDHRISRDRGSVYVRDFAGSGPAFLLLHGFPDNSHIYDDLIPHLVSVGRRHCGRRHDRRLRVLGRDQSTDAERRGDGPAVGDHHQLHAAQYSLCRPDAPVVAPQDGRLAPQDGLDRSDAFFRSHSSRARVGIIRKKRPKCPIRPGYSAVPGSLIVAIPMRRIVDELPAGAPIESHWTNVLRPKSVAAASSERALCEAR